jgi:S-(hydroxymethyl)glutathione dehydrogenase/alcohol dehydrogenase
VLIGQPTENALAGFPPFWIAQDENRVIGSSYGSTRPVIDFPKALHFVKHGMLNLKALVSDVWPFARINEAIALVETGKVNRMVLRFDLKADLRIGKDLYTKYNIKTLGGLL